MVDTSCFRSREVVWSILQLVAASLISLNCAYVFTYSFDPGPRSKAFKQTWLYTAYPAIFTTVLIIANALLTLHRRTFNFLLGAIAGPFCFGVFISTFNLVVTCCSMIWYISLGLLHLFSAVIIILPLAICNETSAFSKGKFKQLKIPDKVKPFLPQRRDYKHNNDDEDKTTLSDLL